LLLNVDKLCYLGNVLDTDGGCDLAVMAVTRKGWESFADDCQY